MTTLLLALTLASCTTKYDVIIREVNIIDIQSGSITTMDVLIKDSLIQSISSPGSIAAKGEKTIQGKGYYLIPGLWDMHVHLQDSSYLRMFLDYGITGIRDMGGCVDHPTNGCESLCPEYHSRTLVRSRVPYWREKSLCQALTLGRSYSCAFNHFRAEAPFGTSLRSTG